MGFQWEQLGIKLGLLLCLCTGAFAQTATQAGPRSLNDILALEEPAARITALQQFLKSNPNGDPATTAREAIAASYAQIGETQLGENNIEKAVSAFQSAIKALPKQVSDRFFEDTVVKIPMAVSARGYRAEAVTLGKALEARFNNEAARLAALGEFYLTIEASGEAIQALENAVRLSPEDARLHRALGAAYRMGLRIDDAIASYQLALRYDAKDRRAYYDLGNLYRSQGAYDDALKLYKKQLEIEPKHSPSYKGLALCYTALGKDDQAAAALNQVRDLRGSSDEISQDILLQTQLAFYLLGQGKLKAARQAAEAALLVEPRFSWARIAAAEIDLAEQKFFEAERHLLAAQQFANFPTLAFTLGKLYLIVEDFDGAAEQFAKAFHYSANDQFTTRLGGVHDVQADELKELLAPEHQAAIFLAEPPTSDELFKIAEALTRTNAKLDDGKSATPATKEAGKEKQSKAAQPGNAVNPDGLDQAVRTFVEAESSRRSYRMLYMARRLAQAGKALPLATRLAEQALELAEVATEAEGSLRDYPNYDRAGRLRTFRGRAHDARGWALFKAGRNQAALTALSEAVTAYGPLPEHKSALRHLAAAHETAGNLPIALELHLAAYDPPATKAQPDLNRTVIELLYRKVHGSLNGLEEKLGQPLSAKTAELVANTARLASAPKPETAEPTPTAAQTATGTAASETAASSGFDVNQLLVNKSAAPANARTAATTSAQRNPAAANKPGEPDAKEPVRLGLYGIPVNPNTPRISLPKPAPANSTAAQPTKEPVREPAPLTPPVNQSGETVAGIAKELPPTLNKASGKDASREPVKEPVETEPAKEPAEEPAAKPATVPESNPETENAKPVIEPLVLPQLDQERLAAVLLAPTFALVGDLTPETLNLPVLDEPPAPAPLVTSAAKPKVTIRYEEAPAPPAGGETAVTTPAQPVSTRPRRISELVPVNQPAPATRKRRVTSAPNKP